MKIDLLNAPTVGGEDKHLLKIHHKLSSLIKALNEKELDDEVVSQINQTVNEINSFSGEKKALKKLIRKHYTYTVGLIKKSHNLVTPAYYQTLWMSLGMGVFGVPFGVIFSVILDNMGLIGVGVPIGMGIGIAIGISLDKKAKEEGKQLDTYKFNV